jgi:hypothetical protein
MAIKHTLFVAAPSLMPRHVLTLLACPVSLLRCRMLNPDLMAAAGGSNLALLAAMQAKTMQAAMQARNAAMLSGAGAAAAAGSGLPEAGFGTPGVSPTCSDAALAQLLAQRELTRCAGRWCCHQPPEMGCLVLLVHGVRMFCEWFSQFEQSLVKLGD